MTATTTGRLMRAARGTMNRFAPQAGISPSASSVVLVALMGSLPDRRVRGRVRRASSSPRCIPPAAATAPTPPTGSR